MARETLRFQTDVAQVVALAFDDGVKVEGRYGDQVMFTLKDDRVMYVPPIVEDRIRDLGIRRGEPFSIVKRGTKNGNRRVMEWHLERGPESAAPEEPQSSADAEPNSKQLNSSDQSNIPPAKVNGGQAGVGKPYVATGAGQYLLSALVNTIDICEAAQQYATAKGLTITFEAADVRALAITAFIQHSRENGGARWSG